MAEFGIKEQDNIGIYSQNMPACFLQILERMPTGPYPYPLYATSSPAQIAYIVHDAEIRTLFVGEQLQYNNLLGYNRNQSFWKDSLYSTGPSY